MCLASTVGLVDSACGSLNGLVATNGVHSLASLGAVSVASIATERKRKEYVSDGKFGHEAATHARKTRLDRENDSVRRCPMW